MDPVSDESIREQVAAILHEVWVEWWRDQRRNASATVHGYLLLDRKIAEPSAAKSRKPYSKLPPGEKSALLKIADRLLELIKE